MTSFDSSSKRREARQRQILQVAKSERELAYLEQGSNKVNRSVQSRKAIYSHGAIRGAIEVAGRG